LRADKVYNKTLFSVPHELVPALRADDGRDKYFDYSMKTSETTNRRILIADDQPDVLEALRLLLKGEGYKTETVTSPAEVLPRLETGDFDLLLMDLNYARDTTSGQEGLDLLSRIQASDITMPVVVMTAWGSVEVAVEAMRRGARDFVQKPWDNARLLSILRTQIELGQALRRGQRLEAENQLLRDDDARPTLIAESQAMQPVLELIAHVGPSDANVLITGEHGTGKEVVAQTLHSISARAAKPLVTVDAGSLSEGVFESELFGHVKGAFTDAKADRVGRFELADGSTLFLDEIANVPLNKQPKLLRVLEMGEFERVGSSKTRRVNVRVLSATNAALDEEVSSGRFRQDLLFRLNTVEIHLPPLRERPEDIPLLAEHFLRQHAQRYRKRLEGFDDAANRALLDYAWPGNVRELEHAVERAVLMAQGERVGARDIGLQRSSREGSRRLEDMSLEEVEAFLIQKALARFDGNVGQAAQSLGLSRSALYRRLQRYGL
jgi:DNA-binding NtrC family response regulator